MANIRVGSVDLCRHRNWQPRQPDGTPWPARCAECELEGNFYQATAERGRTAWQIALDDKLKPDAE